MAEYTVVLQRETERHDEFTPYGEPVTKIVVAATPEGAELLASRQVLATMEMLWSAAVRTLSVKENRA